MRTEERLCEKELVSTCQLKDDLSALLECRIR